MNGSLGLDERDTRALPRLRLLDLFCGAGGASAGYHEAGFDVVGVDVHPQPRYPYEFHQADALDALTDTAFLSGFDVHASPPCQAYSVSRNRWLDRLDRHPELVAPVRVGLRSAGVPYVIENVPGAPLRDPLLVCGASFGLGSTNEDGLRRQLRRHRLFESDIWLMGAGCACGSQEKVGVYGNGGGWANRSSPDRRGYKGNRREAREALGINWMTITELSQAIPPAYTEHIGEQLLAALREPGPTAVRAI